MTRVAVVGLELPGPAREWRNVGEKPAMPQLREAVLARLSPPAAP